MAGDGNPGEEEWADEGDPLATEELALDSDERLPWLESADYEDDEPGVDTARILGFIILGLLALAVLIGGIWFFTNRGPDPDLVADGSTIEAPDGPYKVKPDDPGGQVADGTGDVAPKVGEGKTPEGRLADKSAPKPSIDAAGVATPSSASGSGVAVQVGAYSTRASAEAGWSKLLRQTDALSGVNHRVVEGQADIGTVYRLQAMASDRSGAAALCNALKADGVACQVK